MKRTGGFSAALAALALSGILCSPALGQHWTPPSPTSYSETVWGYLIGFTTLDADDEIAAFRVDNNQIVGHSFISFDGSNYGYNMQIWAPSMAALPVYFLVWDGSSELSAGPSFTSNPAFFPPGAGPTQHDVGPGGVPEPATYILLTLSIVVVWFFLPLRGALLHRRRR